jgi:thymidylate kinase
MANGMKGGASYVASFEGIDCTGKTVLVARLSQLLERRGISHAIKPELPADRLVEEEFEAALGRSIFFSRGFAPGPIAALFFMLYAEARYPVDRRDPARVLLADRSVDSLAVYQGYFALGAAGFDPLPLVRALEPLYALAGLPLPERTFLLTAPIGVVDRRFNGRYGRGLSSEESAVLTELQKAYEELARRQPRFHLLDADRLPEGIAEEALAVILSDLERKGGS